MEKPELTFWPTQYIVNPIISLSGMTQGPQANKNTPIRHSKGLEIISKKLRPKARPLLGNDHVLYYTTTNL